jgi:hypothetical protein
MEEVGNQFSFHIDLSQNCPYLGFTTGSMKWGEIKGRGGFGEVWRRLGRYGKG